MTTLAKRIPEQQQRLVDLRDQLSTHLNTVNDADPSEADLATTDELNTRIGQAEKGLASLQEAERRLATSTASTALTTTSTETREFGRARPFSMSTKKASPLDWVARVGVVELLAHSKKISIDSARQLAAAHRREYDDDTIKALCEYRSKAATNPAMTTVTGWAAELVEQINADFMELLQAQSVYPQLAALGLSLTFGRAGRIL